MHPVPLMNEIALIAAVSVVVTVALGRLKLPAVAGLLLSGAVIGPHGLGWVADMHAIELIAEIGVVFLLFTIGLEFSLSRIKTIFRRVALGGILQVGLTMGFAVAIARSFGRPWPESWVIGFVVALSSTAVVLRGLSERRELDAPHGQFIVGTLIFQDLCVVPMVLMVPILGQPTPGMVVTEIGQALGLASLMVIGVVLTSRLVLPRLLQWVDAQRSREVFLMAVVAICIGTAWLSSLAGLSVALGAFLGGMVVADTEYSHRAMGDVLPLRDIFVSLFFVSLGMLFSTDVLVQYPTEVTSLVFAFVVGKALIATTCALVMKFPARAAWLSGIGLAQFGEFGFVLIQLATDAQIVDGVTSSLILNAGIISMFLTPILVMGAPHFHAGERVLAPMAKLLGARSFEKTDEVKSLSNHVLVIGYGLAGKLVVRTLRNHDIPVVALELNAENVRDGARDGDPVFYADATSSEALGHARVEHARAVVVMINDPRATSRVIASIRMVAPAIPMYVRTNYLTEGQRFVDEGATDFVAGEVEAGLELLARTLRLLDLPRNLISSEIFRAREVTQQSERPNVLNRTAETFHKHFDDLKLESLIVEPNSALDGVTPAQLEMGRESGGLIVAMRRDDATYTKGLGHVEMRAGDLLYVLGDADALTQIEEWVHASEKRLADSDGGASR